MKSIWFLFVVVTSMNVVSANESSVWTLYHSYIGKPDGRIYLATFDSKQGKNINQANCQATAELWNKREKSAKFWCELGRYKE